MVDGTAVLTTMFHGLRAQGIWYDEPGTNWADSGAPYYEVFETADGEYVSVGALERPFYDELVERLGLDATELPARGDESNWPDLKRRFADVFRTKSRAEWCEVLEGTRRVLRPGAVLRRSDGTPAQRRARDVRRTRWRGPAGAGATIRTDPRSAV